MTRKNLGLFTSLMMVLLTTSQPLHADERVVGAKTLLQPLYPLWLAQAGLLTTDQNATQRMTDAAIAGLAKQLPADCGEARMKRDLCGIKPVRVPSSSMNPSVFELETIGIQTLDFRPLKRGDIIVHKARFHGGSETLALTRLIGLPGETIEMKDGVVFVSGAKMGQKDNGEILEGDWGSLRLAQETMPEGSSYTIAIMDEEASGAVKSFGPVTLPPDRYFVLGDNRGNSVDSRYPNQLNEDGLVAAHDIEGAAVIILVSKKADRIGVPLR